MKQILLATLVAVALAGCVSSGTKVTEKDMSGFQRGVTTEQEVITRLGAPNMTSLADDGTRIDRYLYVHASPNAANFIPIVGLMAGGAKGTSTTVQFIYDNNGVLKSYSSSSSQMKVNTGLANQN